MDQITKIVKEGQEILVVNFSDLKEEQMIKLISDIRSLLIREQRMQKVMGIFNSKNYITPKFMRHFETDQREAIVFFKRQAVVGMTMPQKMILKGYNEFNNRNLITFDTTEEAIAYLLDDSLE